MKGVPSRRAGGKRTNNVLKVGACAKESGFHPKCTGSHEALYIGSARIRNSLQKAHYGKRVGGREQRQGGRWEVKALYRPQQ